MHHTVIFFIVFIFFVLSSVAHSAVLGQLTLKDGSLLHGEIIEMVDGTLKTKAAFSPGDPIPIAWSEITGLVTEGMITIVLKNGVILQGTAKLGEPGIIQMATDLINVSIPVTVESVVAINPSPKKPIKYTGNINLGGNLTTGNTNLRQFNFLGELVARSERFRLSLLGRWIYAEDSGSLTTRNTFGTTKLDFFLTERFFLFVSALFEQDSFQDLNLRTSISAGPGYQFIEQGDFSSPYLKDMELYAETGLGFFNEDFKLAADHQFVTGRWAINLDWPVTPSTVIFHQHQGFPSLEDFQDYYITSQQGLRIKLMGNFISTFQINWRYDNTPATGKKPSDFQYLLTIGYQYES
ncbi:MAG: DUF481 domain-containing protein [Nitrospirota bacterium]|nr:DUF481 domain-containing protein [Nitrospirota bacterium]